MIYAEILAGGKGTRMGATTKPKQFIKIARKPIIIHTIEAFLYHDQINTIIVCLPKDWIEYSEKLFKKYFTKKELSKIHIVLGGNDRQESLINGCNYIKNTFGLSKEDIILTHDAVRPFVSKELITSHIVALKNCSATCAAVPATDTIVQSSDGHHINSVPNRQLLFCECGIQGFNLKTLIEIFDSLSIEEKSILTDACKAFIIKGNEVKIIQDEYSNIKITTKLDLIIAKAIYHTQKHKLK